MDPLSALIGAGASLLGGLFNTSSAQAINSQNLQQQMFLDTHAVQLRTEDAKKAGINPLAALGVSSPGFTGSFATEPGAGLAAAGKAISANPIDPTLEKARELALKKGQADVDALNAGISNTKIQQAMNEEALHRLIAHPEWVPDTFKEPAATTSFPIPQVSWMQHIPTAISDWMTQNFGQAQTRPASDYSTP